MSAIVEAALCRGIGGFITLFVILPAAVIFLGYLTYIIVMTVKELKKK